MSENKIKNFGFIIINKPSGPTSHDIINLMRRKTGVKKIGHAGTLDPLASGVLIVAIGREATREISRFVKLDKEYEARVLLGCESDTFDTTGKVKINKNKKSCGQEVILEAINKFKGGQFQTPPMFSAKKVNGKKLYKLARAGKTVERPAVKINIYNLELKSYDWPELVINIKCSSGTYIRSLIHDIGQVLGTGACLAGLVRTAIGEFAISQSIKPEEINNDNWREFLI